MATAAATSKDTAKKYLESLDKKLNDIPAAVQFERTTGVPKSYAALGIFSLLCLMVIFNYAGQLITNLIGFVYPAYASFKSLETPSPEDDKQWLTYWIVFAFFNVIEFFTDHLLYWVPFYFLAKTIFLIWLYLPMTLGAQKIYRGVIRPVLIEHENPIDSMMSRVKKAGTEMASEASKKLH